MMTHEGPFGSATTRNHYFAGPKKGNIYHCGSPKLRDIMIENHSKIVCNIHGHSHDGTFSQNINTPQDPLKIFNPGALSQKEFGSIVIQKDMSNKWKVVEACKYYL